MSTLGQPAPPTPAIFAPELAPPGFRTEFVSFWQDRAIIDPRSIYVHTNGGKPPTDWEFALRFAQASPGNNTCPTYQIDRDGEANKMLPSNRRSIATATVTPTTKVNDRLVWPTLTQEERDEIAAKGQVRDVSLSIETSDLGTLVDPGLVADFTDAQGEKVATAIAYESIVHDFPLVKLDDWFGAGVGGHTDPFTFPFTSIHRGKTCPGAGKKVGLWGWVLPRAIEIRDAWLAPPPDPTPPTRKEKPVYIVKDSGQFWIGDQLQSRQLGGETQAKVAIELAERAGAPLKNNAGEDVTDISQVQRADRRRLGVPVVG